MLLQQLPWDSVEKSPRMQAAVGCLSSLSHPVPAAALSNTVNVCSQTEPKADLGLLLIISGPLARRLIPLTSALSSVKWG